MVVDLGGRPPRVNGFVVAVGRRRVFVGVGRVGEIGSEGVRLRRGSVNLRQFELRGGERLVIGQLIGGACAASAWSTSGSRRRRSAFAWEVATVALGPAGGFPGAATRARGDRLERGRRAVRRRALARPRSSRAGRPASGRDGRRDPSPAAQPPARARLRARGRPLRRPARGAVRGRAGQARRGTRPGAPRARARRDGGRRRRRPAGRVLRQPQGRAAGRDGPRGGRAGPPPARSTSPTRRAA